MFKKEKKNKQTIYRRERIDSVCTSIWVILRKDGDWVDAAAATLIPGLHFNVK